MDNSSESVEREVSDLVVSGPKATATTVDDCNDNGDDSDPDDETSALSIHHQPLAISPGSNAAADEDEAELSDDSSGAGYFTDEEDSEDSGTGISNFGICLFICPEFFSEKAKYTNKTILLTFLALFFFYCIILLSLFHGLNSTAMVLQGSEG